MEIWFSYNSNLLGGIISDWITDIYGENPFENCNELRVLLPQNKWKRNIDNCMAVLSDPQMIKVVSRSRKAFILRFFFSIMLVLLWSRIFRRGTLSERIENSKRILVYLTNHLRMRKMKVRANIDICGRFLINMYELMSISMFNSEYVVLCQLCAIWDTDCLLNWSM